MLGEIRLKLRESNAGPVLQPALLEIRFDPVEASIAHDMNDRPDSAENP